MIRRTFGVRFYQDGASGATAAVRQVDVALRGAAGAHQQVKAAAAGSTAATDQAARSAERLGSASSRARDEAGRFESSTRATSRSLAGLIGKLGPAAAGIAAAGAAFAALKVPASLATSFEFEVAKIRTLGATLPANLEQQLLELAARVPQTAGDITKAAYDAISAGIDPMQVASFLDSASKVAVAGSTSITEAVGALSAATNAYRDSGLTAAQAADSLFGTVRKGVTTFDQLAANQGKSVATAASLGVSYHELNAAVAQLTQVGVPTSEAYTRVNATLQALSKTLGASKVQSLGLVGSLQELQKRNITSAEAIQKMTGRQEAQMGLTVLLKNGLRDYRETLKGVEGATGSAGQAFDTMSATTQGAMDRLKASIDTTLTEVGRQLLPQIRQGLGSISATLAGPEGAQMIQGMTSLAKSVLDVAAAFGKLTGAVVSFVGSNANRLKIIDRQMRSLSNVKGVAEAARAELDAVISINEAFDQVRIGGWSMQAASEVDRFVARASPKIDALSAKAQTLWASLTGLRAARPGAAPPGRPPRRGRGGQSRDRRQELDFAADEAVAVMELELAGLEAQVRGSQTRGAAGTADGEAGGGIGSSFSAMGEAIGQAMTVGEQAVARFGDVLANVDLAGQAIEATSRFREFGGALAENLIASTMHAVLFGQSIQQSISAVLKMASIEATLGAFRAAAKAYEAAGTPFMQWAVGPLLSSAAKWAGLAVVAGAAGVAIGSAGGGGGGGGRGGSASPSTGRPSAASVGSSGQGSGNTTYIVNNSFEGRTFATQAEIGRDLELATRARAMQRGGQQMSRYAARTGRA